MTDDIVQRLRKNSVAERLVAWASRRLPRIAIGILLAAVGSTIGDVDFMPLLLIYAGGAIANGGNRD